MAKFWTVRPMWAGETAAILGGGPSLTAEQIAEAAAAGWRRVAVNDAYRLDPAADILYFCDRRWWQWHNREPAFRDHPGVKVTLENLDIPQVKHLRNYGQTGLSEIRDGLRTGSNGAYQAVNLLAHLGVARIVLLGVDMKPAADGRTHWHGGHPLRTDPSVYRRTMLPKWQTLVAPLAARGIEVVNCSPDSALDAFPRRPLAMTVARWAACPARSA